MNQCECDQSSSTIHLRVRNQCIITAIRSFHLALRFKWLYFNLYEEIEHGQDVSYKLRQICVQTGDSRNFRHRGADAQSVSNGFGALRSVDHLALRPIIIAANVVASQV